MRNPNPQTDDAGIQNGSTVSGHPAQQAALNINTTIVASLASMKAVLSGGGTARYPISTRGGPIAD